MTKTPWYLWAFRALFLVPFVLMAPEVWAGIMGWPHSFQDLSHSTADVLGTSAILAFFILLLVTPVNTAISPYYGDRWYLILRRDAGRTMFAIALFDFLLAAITTSDTFPGGFATRLFGHSFLIAGATAFLLLVPLVLTSTKAAQKWLGRHWKTLHKLTYVVWALIGLHLLLLFGFRMKFTGDFALVSIPLLVYRMPEVRAWCKSKNHRGWLLCFTLICLAVLARGLYPFVQELIVKGHLAFIRNPPNS